ARTVPVTDRAGGPRARICRGRQVGVLWLCEPVGRPYGAGMEQQTIVTANLGFPRIGADRELKWALEAAWRSGSYDDLRAVAAERRTRHWSPQTERGLGRVPVGDASLYDHVLDAALAVGAVPSRFGGRPFDPESGSDDDLARYFV